MTAQGGAAPAGPGGRGSAGRGGPAAAAVRLLPVTEETWPLFEQLFSPTGVQGGCWCAWFLTTRAEYDGTTSAEHRALVRERVRQGRPFGLVAVVDDQPLGWVSLAPRSDYPRLARARTATVPAAPAGPGTWAIVCFYVTARARRQGLTGRLLEAAVRHAAQEGATAVEAYPVQTHGKRLGWGELYHGELGTFLRHGFTVVHRSSERRAVVRRHLRTSEPVRAGAGGSSGVTA